MKQLQDIYQALAQGKLTKEQALAAIKTLRTATDETALLNFQPQWQNTPSVHNVGLTQAQLQQLDMHLLLLSDIPDAFMARLKPQYASVTVLDAAQLTPEALLTACFSKVKTLLASASKAPVLLQVLSTESEQSALTMAINGLLRTAHIEQPEFAGQIVQMERDVTIDELLQILIQEQKQAHTPLLRFNSSGRQVLNWQILPAKAEAPVLLKEQGTYLITGGLGGLGQLFCEHLVHLLPRARVVLTGRGAISQTQMAAIKKLSQFDGQISYRQLDLTDQSAVNECISEVVQQNNGLQGLFHCAGMLDDGLLQSKTEAQFAAVLQAKITSTRHLDAATKAIKLDFFALFSSVAAWFGNTGQADYATANGFLDGFAWYRQSLKNQAQRFGQTLCINWPLWQQGGMQIDAQQLDAIAQQSGVLPLKTEDGLASFHHLLSNGAARGMVLFGNRNKILQFMQQSTKQKLPLAETASVAATTDGVSNAVPQSRELDKDALVTQARTYLCKELAKALKIPVHRIEASAPLEEYGMDSILAVSLTTHLEKQFGALSKTLFFEYQTIAQLADHFIEKHAAKLNELLSDKSTPAEPAKVTASTQAAKPKLANDGAAKPFSKLKPLGKPSAVVTSRTVTSSEPIAIVGISGRYPESPDLEVFWQNLKEGKDCIVEVPQSRWDWQSFYSEDRTLEGAHFSKWGGFIEGVDEFDPRFFNISPRDAVYMDPQERLFLQQSWLAMEDAGLTRAGLHLPHDGDSAGQVGVYAGVMYGEYNRSGSLATIANRVSYCLDLHGPSMTLDTMCSSSLTAIHLACQDLKQGRTDAALAGGVNVSIHPGKYSMLSGGQFISSDGHCQSFGEGGDGYIPGEGVGVVILKRLSDAVKQKHHIYAVISGSAVNHGGKTNGYTVPNPRAQTAVISRALKEAGRDAQSISYIEAHGTGTKLGDPIEIAALNNAFQALSGGASLAQRSCAVGSAKSNIGHCESAAGIAGLTKIILQLKHGQIVPSLHSSILNPHIDFSQTPFEVNQTLRPWQTTPGQPRIAGVSSFGAGGSNAHLVVEEYLPATEYNAPHLPQVVVPLSARTAQQLQQKATELLAHIEKNGDSLALASLAYTLQIGREAMDERLALVVQDFTELKAGLQAFLANPEEPVAEVMIFRDGIRAHKDTIGLLRDDRNFQATLSTWLQQGKVEKFLEFWVKGLEPDWLQLYNQNQLSGLRRISLPGYPFARDSYWQDPTVEETLNAPADLTALYLHPLLQVNESTLQQPRYRSTFTGSEVLFQQSDKLQRSTLSEPALIEMIKLAYQHATGQQNDSRNQNAICIHQLAFGPELVVQQQEQIDLLMLPQKRGNMLVEVSATSVDGQPLLAKAQVVASRAGTGLQIHIAPELQQATTQHRAPDGSAEVLILQQEQHQLYALLNQPADNASQTSLHPVCLNNLFALAQELLVPSASAGNSQWYCSGVDKVSLYDAEFYGLSSDDVQQLLVQVVRTDTTASDHLTLELYISDKQGQVLWCLEGVQFQQVDVQSNVATQSGLSQTSIALTPAETAEVTETAEQTVISGFTRTIPIWSHSEPNAIEDKLNLQLSLPQKALAEAADKFSESLDRNLSIKLQAPQQLNRQLQTNIDDEIVLKLDSRGVCTLLVPATQRHLSASLCAAMRQALQQVSQRGDVNVLLVRTAGTEFLRGDLNEVNAAIEQELFEAIAQLPMPVVAVCDGNTQGAGLLLAAVCDFMLLNEDSHYALSLSGLNASLLTLLQQRFGQQLTGQLLLQSGGLTGKEWVGKGLQARVLESAKLETYAQDVCATLASRQPKALRLLKQHLNRHQLAVVNGLEPLQETVQVDTLADELPENPAKYLKLSQPSIGILQIDIQQQKTRYGLKALVTALTKVLQGLSPATTAVVLTSEHADFIPETALSTLQECVPAWLQMLQACPVPVWAALSQNARGAGWLCALACDFQIYSRSGEFALQAEGLGALPAAQLEKLLATSLNPELARELLALRTRYTGATLSERSAAIASVAAEKVLDEALQQAKMLIPQARDFWLSSRNVGDSDLQPQSVLSMPASVDTDGESDTDKVAVSLRSDVIKAWRYHSGVLLVEMADREGKNTFTDAFAAGMEEVFSLVASSEQDKVLILTGFDNYFASGGTRDTLLAIQEGRMKFTDSKVYQLALMCDLPVVAAMQGHAIGAGWALGMFADFTLFCESAQYISPYMKYGFTPGAASTLVMPEKLGQDLAFESLLLAQELTGKTLYSRGLSAPVYARKAVLPAALQLARSLAQYDKPQLLQLKNIWSRDLRARLEDTYSRELALHEQTFVGSEQTLALIEQQYDATQENTTQKNKAELPQVKPAAPASVVVQASPVPAPQPIEQAQVALQLAQSKTAISLPELLSELRAKLAAELHMSADEIDDDTQFVDLGLDSITGVTWMRNINAMFGTELEATKVYSYPTLQQLAKYLQSEISALASQPEAVVLQVTDAEPSHSKAPVKLALKTPEVAVVQTAVAAPVSQVQPPSEQPPSEPTAQPEFASADLQQIKADLQQMLAEELHLELDEVEDDEQFVDLGLDSITGVTWIRRINTRFNLALEATKVYSYPTLLSFSQFVTKQLGTEQSSAQSSTLSGQIASQTETQTKSPTAATVAPAQTAVNSETSQVKAAKKPSLRQNLTLLEMPLLRQHIVLSHWPKGQAQQKGKHGVMASEQHIQPIAIVGMAGQFAKAQDLEQFWRNIAEAKNCVDEIPEKRWSIEQFYQEGPAVVGKTNSKWMGALDNFDQFDPLFFNISPTEAEAMDPQQRVFLESCWNTLEHAGYSAEQISGSRCGVFVGCATGDYGQTSRSQQTSSAGFTGGATSILAARISYFLNLQGPCLAIDTACSSSLVALASACDSLNSGASDMALAGGVYVSSGPDMHIKSAQSGMLSQDGRCFTFDQRANGFVPGEGTGAVLLKRLDDAIIDNDIIHGVIKAWGVNQDGKTNGITAPNAESQTRLLQQVYDTFGIDPQDIQLIEAHGTGTKLGDPIEIDGLKAAFKPYTNATEICALGSVKSNIGHCLTAAGIAGTFKILLAMRHEQLPPSINFEQLNEHIDLSNTPFFVNHQLQPWRPANNKPKLAAISSFGFSGTNAHLVFEQPPENRGANSIVEMVTQQGRVPVVLSAKTETALQTRVVQLHQWLQQHPQTDLARLAWTLQMCREPMNERLAIMTDSVAHLQEELAAFVDNKGKKSSANLMRASINQHKEALKLIRQEPDIQHAIFAGWVNSGQIKKLVDLWVKGLSVDWLLLYPSGTPTKLVLPQYPFDHDRYWLEDDDDSDWLNLTTSGGRGYNTSGGHPLLQQQVRSFAEQGFEPAISAEKASDNRATGRGELPSRVPLPTYPFAREYCWVDVSKKVFEPVMKVSATTATATPDSSTIEAILMGLDEESLDTADAVRRLKAIF